MERFMVLTCFSIKTFCVNSSTFPADGLCTLPVFFLWSSPSCVFSPVWGFVCLLYIPQDAEIGFSFKAHCLVAASMKLLIEAFRKFQNKLLSRNNTLEHSSLPLTPHPPHCFFLLLQKDREALAKDECVLAKPLPLLRLLWFLCLLNKMFLLLICYRIGSWLPPNA